MLEGQIRYVAAALRALESEGLGWIDVRPEVQPAFNTVHRCPPTASALMAIDENR